MFEKRLLSSKILYAHKIFSREISIVEPGNQPKGVAVAEDIILDLSEWFPDNGQSTGEISQTEQGSILKGTSIVDIAGTGGSNSMSLVLRKMFNFIGQGITRFSYTPPKISNENGFAKSEGGNQRHAYYDLDTTQRLTEISLSCKIDRGELIGQEEDSNPNPMVNPYWEGVNKNTNNFNAAVKSITSMSWRTTKENGVLKAIGEGGKAWTVGAIDEQLDNAKYNMTFSVSEDRPFTGMEILEWGGLLCSMEKWGGEDIPLNDDEPRGEITKKTGNAQSSTDAKYTSFVANSKTFAAFYTIVARMHAKFGDKNTSTGAIGDLVNYVKDPTLQGQESLQYNTQIENTYKLPVESVDGIVHQYTQQLIILGYTNQNYPATTSCIYVPVDLGTRDNVRKKNRITRVESWYSNQWTFMGPYNDETLTNGWVSEAKEIGSYWYEEFTFKAKILGDGLFLRLHLGA
jgi:hypothetical protein